METYVRLEEGHLLIASTVLLEIFEESGNFAKEHNQEPSAFYTTPCFRHILSKIRFRSQAGPFLSMARFLVLLSQVLHVIEYCRAKILLIWVKITKKKKTGLGGQM